MYYIVIYKENHPKKTVDRAKKRESWEQFLSRAMEKNLKTWESSHTLFAYFLIQITVKYYLSNLEHCQVSFLENHSKRKKSKWLLLYCK